MLYAGSQAQSDNLLMGGDNSMQVGCTSRPARALTETRLLPRIAQQFSACLKQPASIRPPAHDINVGIPLTYQQHTCHIAAAPVATSLLSSLWLLAPQPSLPSDADLTQLCMPAPLPPALHCLQAVGAESSFTIDNGSVDEVMAQISAERAAGLADEPQLRPEATLSSSFEGMMNPPSAGAADAAASWGAAAATGAAADAGAADGQHPSLTDCVAAVEEPLTTAAEAVEVDEAPDAAMAAFDHMYVHIASPGVAEADLQHPNLSDCVAAVEEPLPAQAEPAPLVVVDEAPDAAMAAFDHTSLDTPAAAAVAGGNQTPNLQDIALAVESSPLPPSLDESLGEDEEPDVALAAFDHIDVPAPAAAAAAAAGTVTAAVTDDGAAAAAAGGYDQAYLDPLQPSATVGSGSVDLADAEVLVTAAAAPAAAAPAAPAAAAAVPAKQQQAQQQQQKVGAGQGAPDLSVMVQRWWASVVAMFEDWQKNLSGPK